MNSISTQAPSRLYSVRTLLLASLAIALPGCGLGKVKVSALPVAPVLVSLPEVSRVQHTIGANPSLGLTFADCGEADQVIATQSATPPSASASGWVSCATGTAVALNITGSSLYSDPSETIRLWAKNSLGVVGTNSEIVDLGWRTGITLGQTNGLMLSNAEKGMAGANAIWSDGTRLATTDEYNGRVSIWTSLPTTTGAAPDLVLGQSDLHHAAGNRGGAVSAGTIYRAYGITKVGAKFVVSDSGSNRVLIWNTFPTVNGQNADVVLGQTSFVGSQINAGLSAPTASTLRGAKGTCTDGTNLVLADTENNRVLVWNQVPTVNGAPADLVLGKDSFTSAASGTTATSMWAPWACAFHGTKLVVSDYLNHRLLVWNTMPTVSGTAADYAIGQPDLTSGSINSGGAASEYTLRTPSGVASDGTYLAVADRGNNRILLYESLPASTAGTSPAATRVFGQTGGTVFTGVGAATGTMSGPLGVAFAGARVFVADHGLARVGGFNAVPAAGNGTASADFTLGVDTVNSARVNRQFSVDASLTRWASAYGVVKAAGRIYMADNAFNRVLGWTSEPATSGAAPDILVGQLSATAVAANTGGVLPTTFSGVTALAADEDSFFAADTGNHRVLYWNGLPDSGDGATWAYGQASTSAGAINSGGVSRTSLSSPRGVAVSGTRVVIGDTGNHRVFYFSALPTANQSSATRILGQAADAAVTANRGVAVARGSMSSPRGVAIGVVDSTTYIAVADYGNSRVMIWRGVPGSDGAAPDVILGQPNGESAVSANTLLPLSAQMSRPEQVVIDDQGRLMVVDSAMNRVLIWNTIPTADGTAADAILGQSTFTAAPSANDVCRLGDFTFNSPAGLWAGGGEIWVGDILNARIRQFHAIEN